MDDPGLGLTFPPQWVEEGLASGRFQRYELPKEIYAGQSANEKYMADLHAGLKILEEAKKAHSANSK